MKYSITALLVLVLVLVACEKDPPKEREFFYIDNEFKDYSIFRPGTWWIYEKDTLSAEDSVYVISTEFFMTDSADFSWQRSRVQFGSSLRGDTTISLSELIRSTSTYYSVQSKNGSTPILNFFSLKPQGYVLELSPTSRMLYKDVLDTTVNGTAYTGVKIFENLGPSADSLQPKELWYAKNTGVIRMRLYNGEVWYLARQNIVQ